MAKVGILVVYVFDEIMKPLFDIHLERIRRHTSCDFEIYATGHKLAQKYYDYVDQNADIHLYRFDVAPELSVREEHTLCLRRLADAAFADGCDSVICMHLDSFPVVDDWQATFIDPINDGTADVVSIVPNGYSAALCWGKDFEETYAPAMLVKDRESADFLRFTRDFPDFDHVETGLGVIFAAYQNNRTWKRVGTDADKKIYGGILFHVVGGTWRTWINTARIKPTFWAQKTWPLVHLIIKRLPLKLREAVRRPYLDTKFVSREGTFDSKMAETRTLMDDPDPYIAECLTRYERSENIYS